MSKTDDPKPIRVRIALDRSDWLAILAVFISCGAFLVSIYEASILREQQEIMQSQQKASVWPYLEPDAQLDIDTSSSSFTLGVANKGVGPARIKHFTLFINDEIVRNYKMIGDILHDVEGEDHKSIAYSYTPPSGVISSNDSKVILEIKKRRKNKLDFNFINFNEVKIGFEICYCSIFGECWTITDSLDEPVAGCQEKIN